MTIDRTVIEAEGLTLAYDEKIVQENLFFQVLAGDIFVIMGGSGCGKSTLLRHLIGLQRPERGKVRYEGLDLEDMTEEERHRFLKRMGVLYQQGALWSSMTLEENVSLPLFYHTSLSVKMTAELARFKLSLVGLAGFENFYPAEISGGMRKRAALARAIALDPEFLFFDEPSAGLDPLSARRLDELILEIRDSLGATVIMVSHELASIYTVATNSVFLDTRTRTMLATGNPRNLLRESEDTTLIEFLSRGTGKREVSLL
ncbi:MAG: ABC transporter ATP-binding protein [Thermodesulfobacteriota bacterium]